MFCLSIISLLVASALGAKIEGRIVGGHDATIEEYPYQVSLLFGNTHSCGGSLIDGSWVLTAAHCISSDKYNVRVGSTLKEQGGVVHKVKQQFKHEGFNESNADFDYALLELEEPVQLSDKVGIIKIADEGSELKSGTKMNVTGWGITEPGPPTNILQALTVPFITEEDCLKVYDILSDRMFCAGSEAGKGICNNDSGGPIVVDGVQYGVVSWSQECGHEGFPGVYAKVSAVRKWINEISGV